MARSEPFRRLMNDIMGADSILQAAEKTGVSTTVLWRVRHGGFIPTPPILGRIVLGYGLSEARIADITKAIAEASDPRMEPEVVIQLGCQMAGLPTENRLRVVDCFRDEQRKANKSAAA